MAWSYRTRRTFTRTARRSFRRRSVARPRYSRRRNRVRRSNKTTSAYVTLTQNAQWTLFQDGPVPGHSGNVRTWNAFQFSPANMPGFLDYRSTYSHFRIVKAKLFMSRTIGANSGTTFNYLTVGSRPFAATQLPTSPGNTASPLFLLSWRLILDRPSGRSSGTLITRLWSSLWASIRTL